MRPSHAIRIATFAFTLCSGAWMNQALAADAGLEFFEAKVRPLLIERCHECHADKKQKGGLRLDSKHGWQQGGDSGAALVPGKPDASLLIRAVRWTDKDLEMPPKQKLSDAEIAVLTQWVAMGAPIRAKAPQPAARRRASASRRGGNFGR
ncbi:MAG: hypothetical protein HC841_07845 [Verrucomicrobiae bacterium]|nr:hypothetical protein [Verrucomicrobiae bacterium]